MQNTIAKQETATQLKRSAVLIGILMLTQVIFGILLNFFMLTPILKMDAQSVTSSLSFLVGFSTILALVLSSFNIVCGLLLPKAVTHNTSRTFILMMIFASAGFVLCALEYIKMTEYVSYATQIFQQSSDAITAGQESFRKTLATGRNQAHFLSIILSSASVLLFYWVVLRNQLLPKPLSLFALFACTMQIIAVGHTLFAFSIPTILQLPLLVSQIIIPIYLIAKGFNTTSIVPS